MLEATGLECQRGGRVLFRALSLALAPGDVVRLAGANGSGKTSLLRILCGLLEPAAGEVTWQGLSIASLREEYSKNVLYLGHAAAVKEDLTAAENLRISTRIAGVSTTGKSILEALDRYGVPKGLVRRMSQGQRRRAALARLALSASVPVWLLDEPFTALDKSASALTEELVAAHAKAGGMVAYTTHHAANISDRKVIQLDA